MYQSNIFTSNNGAYSVKKKKKRQKNPNSVTNGY